MTEEEKIKQLFYRFEDGGLISKDVDQVFDCLTEPLLGIGIGEQGFVTCRADVRRVLETGIKEEPGSHSLRYGDIRILLHNETFASLCAEVIVLSRASDRQAATTKSEFHQSLTLIKERGEWKICALHASAPVVTEETLDAYPLKLAEKALQNMREKISEEVYLAEEQYRQAILADSIAFYIIDFTLNVFEKCQLNGDWCAEVEPGTPYESFILEGTPDYIVEEDRARYLSLFSLKGIREAFADNRREVACEYRLILPDGSPAWVLTVARLITDIVTGNQKGIMYVKNIDQNKRAEMDILNRAACDEMTGVYNKGAVMGRVAALLAEDRSAKPGVFVMLDVDDFKAINDTYGHPLGDEVLIGIARTLQAWFEDRALIGRLGGDEFGVFVTDSVIGRELEELLAKINAIRLPGAPDLRISCSIGVAHVQAGICFEDLYKQADSALYRSKYSGKNQISTFR